VIARITRYCLSAGRVGMARHARRCALIEGEMVRQAGGGTASSIAASSSSVGVQEPAFTFAET
jgi:hypothetical protein